VAEGIRHPEHKEHALANVRFSARPAHILELTSKRVGRIYHPTKCMFGFTVIHQKILRYISRFLCALYLALDANFRLKRKMISNDARDPSLSNGSIFFAPDSEYKPFISKFDKKIEQEVWEAFLSVV